MADYFPSLPIGTIVASVLAPTSPLPDGWLFCDGSTIPPFYPQLITLLSSKVTPNLIGRTLVGAGIFADALSNQTDGRDPQFAAFTGPTSQTALTALEVNDTGGECAHMLSETEMPTHSHTINGGDFGIHHRSFDGSNDSDRPFETNPDGGNLHGTDQSGGGQRHYNVNPYYAVTYIIFAGQPE